MIKYILIVDDCAINRMVLSKIFDTMGIHCIESANGKEAYDELYINPNISLILLDLNMPIMDGYSFLKWYDTSGFNIPVYIISGSPEETFKSNINQHNINITNVVGFMHKPIDINKLKQLVRKYNLEIHEKE